MALALLVMSAAAVAMAWNRLSRVATRTISTTISEQIIHVMGCRMIGRGAGSDEAHRNKSYKHSP